MRWMVWVGLLLCVGCSRAENKAAVGSRSATAREVAPAARDLPAISRRLADVPSGYRIVGWFRRDVAPLLMWLRSWQSRPACVDELLVQVDGYVQAWHDWGARAPVLIHGTLDRARVEACIVAFGDGAGFPFTTRRDGAVTEFGVASGARSFLGWTRTGVVVWHDDRAVVDEIVAGKTSVNDDAATTAMVARVDADKASWIVGSGDFSSGIIQVPSNGFRISFGTAPGDGPLLTMVFANEQLAARAEQMLASSGQDSKLSQPLRHHLTELAPERRGQEVELHPASLLSADPSVVQELVALAQPPRAN